MVHWPMVNGVNMLSTYVTLVMGEVPRAALVINAMPSALTNRRRRTTGSAGEVSYSYQLIL